MGTPGVVSSIANPTFGGTVRTDAAADADLPRVRVRRPILFAYDRTAGLETQTVGCQFEFEYSDDLDAWTRFRRRRMKTATATDHTNADLRPRGHAFTSTCALPGPRACQLVQRPNDGRAGIHPLDCGMVIMDSATRFVPWYCPESLR